MTAPAAPHTTGPPGTTRMTVMWGEAARGDERRVTHAQLIASAARMLRSPAGRIQVAHEPGGRPRLTGPARGLRVSLSHGDGVGAVALGRGPAALGVDIEPVRPLPATALARRWLGDTPADWIAALPRHERDEAFLALWTRKEAVGKARGHGLRRGGLTRPVAVPADWPPTRPPGRRLPFPSGSDTVTTVVIPAGRTRAVLSIAVSGRPAAPLVADLGDWRTVAFR
ncbi:4'-phosphopantetheinyl transferase superfamily protein [Streptomyces dangxiongensis]|uniref:4'-phosphopantetheinyl transferase superfamily protein n=1 Tax=Streptomyces dangxiongensis TaxID=1442032 RepID=A0A3G2JAQ3_9ACTN|nr:4'-phosphopantetheinyl transferase superfamily protein [Streptomyces dangxiongensis]AYN39390.1 4'-phosphopantetheinyl transferase superfamily protein [Streptomyces dangxiongensis]